MLKFSNDFMKFFSPTLIIFLCNYSSQVLVVFWLPCGTPMAVPQHVRRMKGDGRGCGRWSRRQRCSWTRLGKHSFLYVRSRREICEHQPCYVRASSALVQSMMRDQVTWQGQHPSGEFLFSREIQCLGNMFAECYVLMVSKKYVLVRSPYGLRKNIDFKIYFQSFVIVQSSNVFQFTIITNFCRVRFTTKLQQNDRVFWCADLEKVFRDDMTNVIYILYYTLCDNVSRSFAHFENLHRHFL